MDNNVENNKKNNREGNKITRAKQRVADAEERIKAWEKKRDDLVREADRVLGEAVRAAVDKPKSQWAQHKGLTVVEFLNLVEGRDAASDDSENIGSDSGDSGDNSDHSGVEDDGQNELSDDGENTDSDSGDFGDGDRENSEHSSVEDDGQNGGHEFTYEGFPYGG